MSTDLRRRLEQFAANPRCEANARAAMGGVAMRDVARSLGLTAPFGQSPFAIQRGITFERTLFDDDATPLRRALVERKVLPANAAGFVDLRLRQTGGPFATLDVAATAFETHLRAWASTVGDARMLLPSLVAGAALQVHVESMGRGLVAMDVLTVHPAPRPAPITLRVGEVKVYPDRGGFTDSRELATARAQAGLYVHVLRHTVTRLGLTRDLHVADDGFLVLARASSNQPSVRAGEDLRYQCLRAEEMFTRLAPSQRELGESAVEVSSVLAAPKHYGDACLSFCELADHCRDEALRAGIPAALGDDLGRFLGEVTLHRALELLHGQPAATDAERDFLRRSR